MISYNILIFVGHRLVKSPKHQTSKAAALYGPCCKMIWADIVLTVLIMIKSMFAFTGVDGTAWFFGSLVDFTLHTVKEKTLHDTDGAEKPQGSPCAMEVQVTTLAGDCLTFRCKRWTLRDLKDSNTRLSTDQAASPTIKIGTCFLGWLLGYGLLTGFAMAA